MVSAEDVLCSDLRKEPFQEVHPGRADGCEPQPETRAPLKQGLHLRRLVGGDVVENQTDVALFLHGPVDARRNATNSLVRWCGLHNHRDYFSRTSLGQGTTREDIILLRFRLGTSS